jgi:pimeloyl-ACP methyl ester carboxylesterase
MLKLPAIHLISWSDTCATACQLLQQAPSLVQSVVFIGVPDAYRFPFPVNIALNAFHRLPLEWLPVKASVFRLLGHFMGGPILRPEWVTSYAYHLPNLVRLFKFSCLPSILSHHAPSQPLPIPALVVAGDYDPVVPASACRAFAKALGPLAHFCLLPELEHIPMFAQPEILSQNILRFLNR